MRRGVAAAAVVLMVVLAGVHVIVLVAVLVHVKAGVLAVDWQLAPCCRLESVAVLKVTT